MRMSRMVRTMVMVLVAAQYACVGGGTGSSPTGMTGTRGTAGAARGDSAAIADDSILMAIASSQQVVADSVRQVRNRACDEPLTGLLRKRGRLWEVTWQEINAHLQTLTFEASRGESGHVLQPVTMDGGAQVTASIASVAGTEQMSEVESLHALNCGRVIARIISTGDHPAMEVRRGTNYLVIARTNPPESIRSAWVFVILNPEADYRASLDKFTYTPHVTGYGSPVFTGRGRQIRETAHRDNIIPRVRGRRPYIAAPTPVTGTPLSPAAQGCLERGFKACFIDQHRVEPANGAGGLRAIGKYLRLQSISQPWVPCPLFGCCCGGDACHEDS